MLSPLLVSSKQKVNFSLGMLGFTEFHEYAALLTLSVTYTLLIITANGRGICMLRANQLQNKCASAVISNSNVVMLVW